MRSVLCTQEEIALFDNVLHVEFCVNLILFCTQGCLLKLQEVMQSYVTIVGAIIVSIWAVVVGGIISDHTTIIVYDTCTYKVIF